MEQKGDCSFDIILSKSVPHVLEQIFFYLDYKSFKNCQEVCKAWKEQLTSESVQRKARSVYSYQKKLYWAAFNGNTDAVKVLLKSGADPNMVDKKGKSLLYLSVWRGNYDVAEILLDARADPNMADDQGLTPLHWAAYYGNTELVKVLLKTGADPKKKDNRGLSPLKYVVSNYYTDVIKLLLDTDFPAYSDTGYSDTPVRATVLACPKWPFIYQK